MYNHLATETELFNGRNDVYSKARNKQIKLLLFFASKATQNIIELHRLLFNY